MKKVLFVCIENSCRSQMAEAFAKMHGKDVIESFSAGSNPSGIVNPKAIQSMKEVGYDLSKHKSIGLEELPQVKWDYVFTMGCGEKCPMINANKREDWALPDPKSMEMNDFNRIRDMIESEVKSLIDDIHQEKD